METLLSFDASLFLIINSHNSPFFDHFFWIVTQLGLIWVSAPLVFAIVLKKAARKYLKNTFVFTAIASAICLSTVTVIKVTVDRQRPVVYFEDKSISYMSYKAAAVDLPSKEKIAPIPTIHIVGSVREKYSFPSGHTAAAFTGAMILFYLFGGWFWTGFLVAALVGYSRVYVGAHFPLDVVGAMGLAVVITWGTFFVGSRRKIIPQRGKFG
ncbi:MAG: phosphatase PAP2 family protein [Chitinispirillales bacterium]|jgi:undecaprenyl-diphosphatase|nr:phosphatase PAP2 family protein [Chitinispirillales bacterium]